MMRTSESGRCSGGWRRTSVNLLQHAARTRGRRPAGYGRPDRRRQVRHHVPVAGAADARHACRRRRRPQCRRAPRASSRRAGWAAPSRSRPHRSAMRSRRRRTHVTDDADALIALPGHRGDRRGDRRSEGRHRHALKAIAHGKHIVMVNVEADALAGPLLARKAKAAGVVYSLAWGDQPALICEHVDWARACGFKVIAAGKGTRYEPHYHHSNARHRVGHPRQVPADQGPQLDQSEDVQLASSTAPSPASR